MVLRLGEIFGGETLQDQPTSNMAPGWKFTQNFHKRKYESTQILQAATLTGDPGGFYMKISMFLLQNKPTADISNIPKSPGMVYLSMVVSGSPKRWDRWHIIPRLAVYTTYIYILPSGGLYATYHLLGEPETTTIEFTLYLYLKKVFQKINLM